MEFWSWFLQGIHSLSSVNTCKKRKSHALLLPQTQNKCMHAHMNTRTSHLYAKGTASSKHLIALIKALFFNPKVLIFFLFLQENICCGYSLEAPQHILPYLDLCICPCASNHSKGPDHRASINFQTQEVPDFLPLKFGSPTGKSRKSHFFTVLQRSALSLVEHRFLFLCHTESSWYTLLLDVF